MLEKPVTTEKPEHPIEIEPNRSSNQSTVHQNTEKRQTEKEASNVEDIKRMMSEKKTNSPSFRNRDCKTVKVETKKN